MRLWHKDLISVLPRKQLIAQWRECCAIISKIDKCGSPNHALVNKVLHYPITHFVCYTNSILYELHKRGYKVSESSYSHFTDLCNKNIHLFNNTITLVVLSDSDIFKDWHNNRYLKQCYYNLQEKYDCGIITDEEWDLISPSIRE